MCSKYAQISHLDNLVFIICLDNPIRMDPAIKPATPSFVMNKIAINLTVARVFRNINYYSIPQKGSILRLNEDILVFYKRLQK